MKKYCALFSAMTAISAACAQPALAASPALVPAPSYSSGGAPTILGTTPVAIRADRFMSLWQHASEDASGQPLMRALIRPAMAMTAEQKIAYIQAVVTNNIRWQSDATQWGKHDYWASAAQTLAAGAGDAEDRAIVKLQALKALGFRADDLFLTMARDTVGGPMTVLSVRRGNRFEILADSGTPFFATTRWREFKPLISIGNGKAWLHAASPSFIRKPVQAAAVAATAAPLIRR